VAELIRGKAGQVFGNLISLLTMMKSLPLAYNRDMQEDKKPLFETVDTVKACLRIYTHLLPKLGIKIETLHRASNSGYLNATDLADYLVSKGMSFREAHGCVGGAVSHAIAENKELHELDLDMLKTFSERIEGDVFSILTPEAMVNRRLSAGGTATSLVRDAIKAAETELVKESQALTI
jgi:argininosuccinate lyase